MKNFKEINRTFTVKKNSIFNAVCKTRYLALLVLLMFTYTEVWATDLTTEDLNFGTPAVSENFENVSNVTTSGSSSSYTYTTNHTNYGLFTIGYLGRTTGISYEVKAAATPMQSRYLEIKSKTNGAGMCFTRTFATTGAFSFTIAKSSKTYIGLYNNTGLMSGTSGDFYAKAKSSVYLVFNDYIAINSGSGWVNVVNSGDDYNALPDVFDVTVVYNNTSSTTSYNGGNTALAAKTANVFINGTAIMDGDSPKAFTIPGAVLGAFRVIDNQGTYTTKVDDIKIYDALPTAGTTYSVTWMSNGVQVSQTTNVSSGSAVTPPAISPLPCGDKLMGWTDATNGAYVHGTSTLETGATITITGDKTYYAVFADEE